MGGNTPDLALKEIQGFLEKRCRIINQASVTDAVADLEILQRKEDEFSG